MKKSSILLLLIAFVFGIIAGSFITIHWIILFTCWATFIFSLIAMTIFGEQLLFFRKWITWNIIAVFFLSGVLGYHFNLPTSYENEFSKNYLLNDKLIGEIIDYQKGNGDYDKAIIEVRKVVKPHTETNVQGKLLCYIRSENNQLSMGNVLLFQPDIQSIKNKNNPGEFNAEQYWKIKGITKIAFVSESTLEVIGDISTFSRFWTKSRNYLIHVIQKYVSEENQGLVTALSLGDKSNLSMEKRNHFANAGAMHVLAVSGMHVGILLAFLHWIFHQFKFLRKRNIYLYFALILLWCFAFLTGASASVIRAVTMFSILGLSQILGKKFFGLNAIFVSALLLLIFNPLLLFDIGFQLSYLAVLGIALFYQRILNLFHSSFAIINWLWKGTAIGIAAQIGTVPLSLLYFNQFPNFFFLTNIGLLILAAGALISVVLFFIVHFIPFIVDILAYVVNFIFDVLTHFISWINMLPGEVSTGFTPHIIQVVLLYFGALFSLYQWNKRNMKSFKIGTFILFIVSLSLIFNREKNKSKEELIVLNHYEKVILLKNNRRLFLLYDGENRPSLSALDYLTSGYESSVGVKADKIPLPQNMRISFSKDIDFENGKNGIKLNYYGKKYFLAHQINSPVLEAKYQIVKGDWNPYLPDEYVNINTKKNALIVKANDK